MKTFKTLAVLVCVLIFAPAAQATLPEIEYVEDFHTTTYLDPANTTAEWDTTAGVIKLPAFEQTFLGAFNPSGYVLDAVPWGPYVLVASGSLAVYDVSDPTDPHSVEVVSTAPATIRKIAAAVGFAWLVVAMVPVLAQTPPPKTPPKK